MTTPVASSGRCDPRPGASRCAGRRRPAARPAADRGLDPVRDDVALGPARQVRRGRGTPGRRACQAVPVRRLRRGRRTPRSAARASWRCRDRGRRHPRPERRATRVGAGGAMAAATSMPLVGVEHLDVVEHRRRPPALREVRARSAAAARRTPGRSGPTTAPRRADRCGVGRRYRRRRRATPVGHAQTPVRRRSSSAAKHVSIGARSTRSSAVWAIVGSPGPKLAAGTPWAAKRATSVQPSLACDRQVVAAR